MKTVSINSTDFVYSEPSKYSMVTLGQDEVQLLVLVHCELYPQHKDKLLPHGLPTCANMISLR